MRVRLVVVGWSHAVVDVVDENAVPIGRRRDWVITVEEVIVVLYELVFVVWLS